MGDATTLLCCGPPWAVGRGTRAHARISLFDALYEGLREPTFCAAEQILPLTAAEFWL